MQKILIKRSYLVDALKAVAPIIKDNAVLPVLENFKLEVFPDAQALTIQATDLETTVTLAVPVISSTGPFSFLLGPIEYIAIQNMKNDTVEFEIGDTRLSLINGRYKAQFVLSNVEEFPITPAFEQKGHIVTSAIELQHVIAKAIQFRATDELRPAMCGVCFDYSKQVRDGLVIAATDAHALFVSPVLNGNIYDLEGKFIFPAIPMKMLLNEKLISGPVTISTDYKHARIGSARGSIITRLIDAPFPDFGALLEGYKNDWVNSIDLNRKEFVECVGVVKATANASTQQIVLRLAEGSNELFISSSDIDGGFQSEMSMIVTRKNIVSEEKNIAIAFNSGLLLTCINLSKNDTFTMQLTGHSKGAVNVGADDDISLCMPLMLNDGDGSLPEQSEQDQKQLPPPYSQEEESLTGEPDDSASEDDPTKPGIRNIVFADQKFQLRRVEVEGGNDSLLVIAPVLLGELLDLDVETDKQLHDSIFAYVPEVLATPKQLSKLKAFKSQQITVIQ